ncbi:MAG: chemotaxis protein CheW [Candidatus Dadabacteria bacterium]|nr:MAG: chemotaxis protein CheW [Candidatus Dadabacteria bacterium]
MADFELSSWGFADDSLNDEAVVDLRVKHLVARVGDQTIAIADRDIREVVDRPKVAPWLRDDWIAGVFALRGDIYTLTDPLGQGVPRRVAVAIEAEGRYLAVGVDQMVGVRFLEQESWQDLGDTPLIWARRVCLEDETPLIELPVSGYLEAIDTHEQSDTGAATIGAAKEHIE